MLVLGAGIGGLTAANVLAQTGKRVLVLEQHTVPGGLSQSFRRAGWSWDVGLHLVGELGPRGLAAPLFHALSGGRLEWTRTTPTYDVAHLPGGLRVEYRESLAAQRRHLVELFPREQQGIARWFRMLHDAAVSMRGHFIARGLVQRLPAHARDLALARTSDVLDSVTRDPRLRTALSLHWLFYGTPPSRSAFGVHALLTRHYRHGAYYPVGGAMSLARAFSTELAKHGGWVRTGAPVKGLLVEHGRVLGVRLESGEELRAPAVVSAAGALNTLRLLPEGERRHEWVAPIEALAPSSPHVCLHLGFKGDVAAAGATATNRWLVHGSSDRLWDTKTERPPVTYLAFPSLKDGVEHDGLHTAEVVAFTDWAPFAEHEGTRWRKRGADYEALKARLTDRLLAVLLEQLPGLKALVAYAELSTPLSTAHFTRAVKGSAYGLDSTPERYACRWLRPRTPVKGLHLAGCDVSVVGIAGALMGGLAAAVSLEPEHAGEWMRRQLRTKGGTPC